MKKPHIPLEDLRREVEGCRRCPLCDGRTQTVFGAGNPHARVLIVGEAPGKNEDLQGVPFVGAAGRKLDALLEIAGLNRERDVFIANVLKCRPPGNRDPRPEEIAQCTPYLREQTRTIDPEFIVTLGNFATKFILKTEKGITRLHGKLEHAGRFKVFPIFHPAAAIYDRTKQAALEEDFATLGKLIAQSDVERAAREDAAVAKDGATAAAVPADFDPVAYINDPRWHSPVYDLDRIERLLDLMGRPQDRLRFVHVAGTNGKGSTCAYLAKILEEAGYRTGLFTSPYLIRFEERIRVNSAMIPPDDLRAVTLFVREQAERMAAEQLGHPTEFELMTAVALEYFARRKCDVAVLEVGLGGRLDSTNVIRRPELCMIARLGLDHRALLGDTLPEIAVEKAGIIKDGAPVVCYPQDDDAATEVVREAALCDQSRFVQPDFSRLEIGGVNERGKRAFAYRGRPYETGLLGSYQPCNAALAIEGATVLRERGWKIPDEAIAAGIADTVWEGRFEVVQAGAHKPTIIVDGGHNPQGARALADSLSDLYQGKPCVFVMGVLADKEYVPMIDTVLPLASGFMCVTPPNPRALGAGDLAKAVAARIEAAGTANGEGIPVRAFGSFREALAAAEKVAGEGGVVCAFGSLYSIASVKGALSTFAAK